jgi:hypothetical protein
MRVHPGLRGLVVIGHDGENGIGTGPLRITGKCDAWAVEFELASAITGIRPCDAATAMRTIESCSAGLKVGPSPVAPHTIKALAPSSTWR